MAKSIYVVSENLVKRNCRIEIFPDGSIGEILVAAKPFFVPGGYETTKKSKLNLERSGNAGDRERARRRAQKRIETLIRCNPLLDVFFTLTLKPDAVTETGIAISRTDYDAVNKKLQQWLGDRVRRRGLHYVAVYEYHNRVESDGKRALHVHGIANHSALSLVDSGVRHRGKDKKLHNIYNVKDWKLGHTTAMYVYGSREAAIRYISKYVRKSEEAIGGRWYLHSQNLQEPRYVFCNIDFREMEGREFFIDAAKCSFKSIKGDNFDFCLAEDVV